MSRLLDFDSLTNARDIFHYDHTDDTFVVKNIQDVTAIVEANKAEYNQTDEHARWGEFRRVASIPMNIFMELQKKIRGDNAALLKWLDDRDQSAFRTRPGKLSR